MGRIGLAASVLALGLVLPAPVAALSIRPAWADIQPDGSVTDAAGVLSVAEEAALEADLAQYEGETSNEIAVITIPSLAGAPLEDVAIHFGRKWGVGQRNRDNGIVFLVAVEDRAVRLEVGYGLEGAVPDAAANRIIEDAIVPKFREGAYGEGIRAGVAALKEEIGGEYQSVRAREEGPTSLLAILAIHFLVWGTVLFGRTRSWWLGGVVGGLVGVIPALVLRHWWPVPTFLLYGLVLDYVTSRLFFQHRARGNQGSGWWWMGGGSGSGRSGGLGGFGGGSFGGGGAGGRW